MDFLSSCCRRKRLVLALQHCSVSLHPHWTLSRRSQFGFPTQYILFSAECNCFDGSLPFNPLALNVDALSVSFIVFRAAWEFFEGLNVVLFSKKYRPWLQKILPFFFFIEIKKRKDKKYIYRRLGRNI